MLWEPRALEGLHYGVERHLPGVLCRPHTLARFDNTATTALEDDDEQANRTNLASRNSGGDGGCNSNSSSRSRSGSRSGSRAIVVVLAIELYEY